MKLYRIHFQKNIFKNLFLKKKQLKKLALASLYHTFTILIKAKVTVSDTIQGEQVGVVFSGVVKRNCS